MSISSAFDFAQQKDWVNARQHAQNSGDPALITLMEWQALLDPDYGASFEEVTHFIDANPNWPEQKKLQLRAEFALRDTMPSRGVLDAWFATHPPLTGIGKWAYAELLPAAKKDEITKLLREAWKDGDFDESREQAFLEKYGKILRPQDYEARIDRLLWEGKTAAAKRVLRTVNNNHQVLYMARIELMDDNKQAPHLVSKVDSSLKHDPGLLYDRLQWRARRSDTDGVRELLLITPAKVPYPEKWWKMRELQVRKAVDEEKYSLALKLLNHHGQVDGSEYADATWLRGWILLEFKNQVQDAYRDFYDLFGRVKSPVSKARAAYWAGRAAIKAKDAQAAENWFREGAKHPTTFYGQLSLSRLSGIAPLELPAMPAIGQTAHAGFESNLLVHATRLAIEEGNNAMVTLLQNHLIETAKGKEELALVSELGLQMHKPYISVKAAKRVLQQKSVILLAPSYPLPELPEGLGVEKPLILSIARQESEFDPRAVSSSGAVGLTQLLPSTANEVARKLDIPYTESRLYEQDYNINLGSQYLGRLVNGFDGSYVKAAAGYNAGPRRVREWTEQFGSPGNTEEQAVNWIEKIPFAETRNYVQRVTENLQIYRHLLSKQAGETEGLRIVEDITR